MRVAMLLFVLTGVAQAHPGHGAPELHLHGFSSVVILLAVLVAAWVITRRKD